MIMRVFKYHNYVLFMRLKINTIEPGLEFRDKFDKVLFSSTGAWPSG